MTGQEMGLRVLDYFFLVFHTGLILFNLFGWIIFRKAHLFCIGLTFASWLLLGIWYGWGYCFLTDWHWQVLVALGEGPSVNSYISYLLDRFFGLRLPADLVDIITVVFAVLALIISVYVNLFKPKKVR